MDAIGCDRVKAACHAKVAGSPDMRVRLIGPSKSSKSLIALAATGLCILSTISALGP